MRKVVFFILFCCVSRFAFSSSYESRIDDIIDVLTSFDDDGELDDDYLERVMEDLDFYSENPIDLNHVKSEDLRRLHFLSERQIDNIIRYVYELAPVYELHELYLIPDLYDQDILNLLPFVCLTNSPKAEKHLYASDIFRFGKHEVVLRTGRTIEEKQGYTDEETPSNTYLGDPFAYSLRYRFKYKDQVYFGLSGEKDAGELAWGEKSKVFDSYHFSFQLKDVKRLRNFVLGDFRATFGEGLVVNTNFSISKTTNATDVNLSADGLNKFSSLSESNYFRGIGATIDLDYLNLTAMYSINTMDANLKNDTFPTVYFDGLHRTKTEILHKNSIWTQSAALNLDHSSSWYRVGLNGMFTWFNAQYFPTFRPYNLYYFKGNYQLGGSVYYSLNRNGFRFKGETALDKEGDVATINSLTINFVNFSAVVLHRYYSPSYDAFYSRSFGESSTVRNEHGLYLGFSYRNANRWGISSYFDCYQFPWLKSSVSKPSSVGFDAMAQVEYFPTDKLLFNLRFKFESYDKNQPREKSSLPLVLGKYDKSSLRLRMKYNLNRSWNFTSVVEGNFAKNEVENTTFGIMGMIDFSYSPRRIPLVASLRYEIFKTEDYNNRFYLYERDVLYAFSSAMLYGYGNRYYLNLKYQPISFLSIYFKIAQTLYFDKETISSGGEEIKSNHKTDANLLVCFRF